VPATFLKGDLFETKDIRAYAHGCNCAGAMDAGISIAFKKRWPAMFEEYAARCADGRLHLGDVLMWTDGETTIYNLAIQQHWKTRSKLAALTRALHKMVQMAEQAGIVRVGLPRMGAALGAPDARRVKSIVEGIGAQTSVELVVFEQFVRAASA